MTPPTLPHLRLRCTLEAEEPARLPRNPGSTLRGAFGHALRAVACSCDPRQPYAPCPLRSTCAYRGIFEPPLEGQPPSFLPGLRSMPRPYVFEPGPSGDLKAGETLGFDLLLFGRAMAWAPHVLVAVERMAAVGLTTQQHRFSLAEVVAPEAPGGPRRLLRDGRWIAETGPALAAEPRPLAGVDGRATVELVTPLCFSGWDAPTRALRGFPTLVHLMFRRVLEMTHFHGGAVPREWTYRRWLAAADRIEVTRAELRVESWSRESQRQERAVPMAGLVGILELAGDLRPFLPLFSLAQVTHVGKSATLGLGRLRITA